MNAAFQVIYYFFVAGSILYFYIPVFIAISCFLLAHFHPSRFVTRWQELSKSLFCSLLQALSLFLIVYISILGYIFGDLSSVLVADVYCISLIIFSALFAWYKSRFSWLWGTLLFLFSVPMLRSSLGILLANSGDLWYHRMHFEWPGHFLMFGLLLLLLLVQMISMAIFARSYFKHGIWKILKLLVIIVISHILALLIIASISRYAQRYIDLYTPRLITQKPLGQEATELLNTFERSVPAR